VVGNERQLTENVSKETIPITFVPFLQLPDDRNCGCGNKKRSREGSRE
jgi:hypothetical protein